MTEHRVIEDGKSGAGTFVERHRFLVFYLLALAIVVVVMLVRVVVPGGTEVLSGLWEFLSQHGLYPNIVSIGWFALTLQPLALSVFVFAGAPSIAAIVTSAWIGAGALPSLLGRLRLWRGGVSAQQGRRVYGELIGIYAVGIVGYLLVTGFFAGGDAAPQTYARLGGALPWILFWLAVGPFIDEGGTLEELGWRGFGLPALLERVSSPLFATLLLGFLWWAWHFPREIPGLIAGLPDPGLWLYYQGLFLLLCLALSVIITYYWFRTGGSVWPGILIHGLTNVWSKALGTPVNEWAATDVRSGIVYVWALIILVLTRGGLGDTSPLSRPGNR